VLAGYRGQRSPRLRDRPCGGPPALVDSTGRASKLSVLANAPSSNHHLEVTEHRRGRYRWPTRPPPRLTASTRQPSAATTSERSTCRYSAATSALRGQLHTSRPVGMHCIQLTVGLVLKWAMLGALERGRKGERGARSMASRVGHFTSIPQLAQRNRWSRC
jgi:hypothetical protein